MILLALLSCGDPAPDAILAGDWRAAAAHSEQAAALHRLEAQRRALHPAEFAWTYSRLQLHLAAGRSRETRLALEGGFALSRATGIPVAPFEHWVEPALSACSSAHCRAELRAGLALAGTRDQAASFEAATLRDGVLGAFSPGGWGPQRCAGVRPEMATAAWAVVQEISLNPPSEADWTAGAHARLRVLQELPGLATRAAPLPLAPTWEEQLRLAAEWGFSTEIAVCQGVEGALSATDPYARAIWPSDLAAWEQHQVGVRVGAGLRLYREGMAVLLDTPTLGSPAWDAGLKRGDRLVEVESPAGRWEAGPRGEARDRALEQLLTGAEGEPLSVRFFRDGGERVAPLIRRAVPEERLRGLRRAQDNSWIWELEPGILYVEIPRFLPETGAALAALAAQFPETQGVILDLRDNEGGDLAAAMEAAELWIAAGPVLLMTGPGAPPPPNDLSLIPWNEAVPGGAWEGLPVVVLVEHRTASAAEMLAGSLQERAGATLIGAPTWGKGMAQGLRALPEGFALQLTNAAVTLPSGRPLDRAGTPFGLLPDLAAPETPVEGLKRRALRARASAPVTYPDGSPVPAPSEVEDLPAVQEDYALAASRAVLRAKIALRDPP